MGSQFLYKEVSSVQKLLVFHYNHVTVTLEPLCIQKDIAHVGVAIIFCTCIQEGWLLAILIQFLWLSSVCQGKC
jgi:hypothetical protein